MCLYIYISVCIEQKRDHSAYERHCERLIDEQVTTLQLKLEHQLIVKFN